jgi:hypothetical protein
LSGCTDSDGKGTSQVRDKSDARDPAVSVLVTHTTVLLPRLVTRTALLFRCLVTRAAVLLHCLAQASPSSLRHGTNACSPP